MLPVSDGLSRVFPTRWRNAGVLFSVVALKPLMCVRVVQSDCTIHNVGHEFPGNCGITAFYSRGLRILHNEIYDIPYTGISVGWGWNFAQRKTWPRMP